MTDQGPPNIFVRAILAGWARADAERARPRRHRHAGLTAVDLAAAMAATAPTRPTFHGVKRA